MELNVKEKKEAAEDALKHFDQCECRLFIYLKEDS